ncbi:LysR family transcriptional regulator [Marinobacter salsuginis]|uniref:LysR family transcriptional regulator n=1 Tax=Marinobacter salsuginis TaxID=418719 RepID=UPI001AE0912D|nr:LysR family transcriptional regulator [Marinobacter salsuginis]QTN40774.1 LysR family transcriptional regulator [Marinobacter salsuginis]
MNIASKDLNLLKLFQVLYEERSVSGAAERINLSQPALSHKLAKLRDEFDDTLFARAPRGLTPTPRAHQLAPLVQQLVRSLESFYDYCDEESFLLRADRIHIFATDYIEQLLLPKLLPVLREQAPNTQLVFHNTRGKLPRSELETGTCDIAIAGFFEGLPDTFYQQKIHQEEFSVLASRTNTRIVEELTLEAFLECDHLVTTLTGDLDGVVDRQLEGLGHQRKVVAGMSSFLSPVSVIEGTDLIITCLGSIAAHACAQQSGLTSYRPPIDLPKVEILQTWHQRTHEDQLRAWLRRQIKQLLRPTRESAFATLEQ